MRYQQGSHRQERRAEADLRGSDQGSVGIDEGVGQVSLTSEPTSASGAPSAFVRILSVAGQTRSKTSASAPILGLKNFETCGHHDCQASSCLHRIRKNQFALSRLRVRGSGHRRSGTSCSPPEGWTDVAQRLPCDDRAATSGCGGRRMLTAGSSLRSFTLRTPVLTYFWPLINPAVDRVTH